MLNHWTIARKLTAMFMLISGLALLLTSAAFAGYQYWSFRRTARDNLLVRAEIIAANSICRPMHSPRKGFERVAATTASRAPLAASWRMQSGMAPWPGTTILSLERISSGSAVTRTVASGATCSMALDTERRFPMP